MNLLSIIGFETDKLDHGIELSRKLEVKLAQCNAEAGNGPHAVYLKQAYLHLKEAVSEIRSTGKFINKDNKERLLGYASALRRLRAQKYKNSAQK